MRLNEKVDCFYIHTQQCQTLIYYKTKVLMHLGLSTSKTGESSSKLQVRMVIEHACAAWGGPNGGCFGQPTAQPPSAVALLCAALLLLLLLSYGRYPVRVQGHTHPQRWPALLGQHASSTCSGWLISGRQQTLQLLGQARATLKLQL